MLHFCLNKKMLSAVCPPAILTSSLAPQLWSEVLGQMFTLYKLRGWDAFSQALLVAFHCCFCFFARLHRLSKALDGLRPGVSRSSPRLKDETELGLRMTDQTLMKPSVLWRRVRERLLCVLCCRRLIGRSCCCPGTVSLC